MKNADLIDLLSDINEYLDRFADCDWDWDWEGPTPNKAMMLCTRIEEQLEKLKNQ